MVAMIRGFTGDSVTSFDDEVSEISLLLPRAQAAKLEQAAHRAGLTTAQFLRRLIAEVICARDSSGYAR
jgi:hypothetical protein